VTDENNPDIYVEYSAEAFPPTNWENLKTYAVSFNVKNSGTLKTPESTLVLKNTSGRYTGNGSLTLGLHKLLRVRADVRGTIDTIFYGRIASLDTKNEKQKSEFLTVTCRGMTQKLLNDSITHDYLDEQTASTYDRTMKQVIEDLLVYTDTGEASGITLITDTGDITTVKAKNNFERETLLDAIKKICEYVGYTGYEEVVGSAINLNLYPYGWQATNPTITIGQETDDLGNQIISRSFSKNTDDILNHIYVYGGAPLNYPDSDRFTENGFAKGWWTAGAGCTVSDDTTHKCKNLNSIKIVASATFTAEATLNLIPTFGAGGLDVKTKKLAQLNFALQQSDNSFYKITLIDTSNREIGYIPNKGIEASLLDVWFNQQITIGHVSTNNVYQTENVSTGLGYGAWKGDVAFDWEHVAKIRFNGGTSQFHTTTDRIDGLCFTGNIEADPRKDPTLAATDATSISLYGRRLYQYEDDALRSYEAIRPMADQILKSTKDPLIKLIATVGAKTWVKPNQYLTVNMPIYGISNELYRIVELEYDWTTKTKLLRSALSLTPRTQPVTSRDWYAAQLDGILKNLIW
jgi:prophage tail gpP-like protein